MTGNRISRRHALLGTAAVAGAVGTGGSASADAVARPRGGYARNVEVVGYSDLDHRPGFKMAVREKRGRWYLYLGHFWHSGWTVLDVTRPARPEVAAFVPGPENTWTLQVDLSGDLMVTALEQIFPNFGGDPAAPFEDGIYLWDIADPVRPRRLGHYRTGGTGTHRNLYPGGRYVHLAAGMPGYRGNIYVILDIADPANPVEAGRWWVPGQHESEPSSQPRAAQDGHLDSPNPCCSAGHDVSLHGPPYVVGDLAYLPYGGAGLVVLDIADVSRPRQVGHLSFSPPFHSRFGVHGVLPLPERGIAFANSESVTYAEGPAHHASIVDISDPANPYLLSLFPEPVPPPGAAYPDFATRGGWRGPHNMNHHQHHPDVQPQGGLFYLAHFNAGLRVYDVSNTRLVREVGYFLPPEPTRRYGPMPADKLVLQTEDVVVDRRGYIYITDKNQGVWILRYTGPKPTVG
ncbi:LVIVD repeat-containing protein [Plantactinospora sp. CA-290183]|uniref:LVIVD repeat-containing protein n=1 Tax=Plantactinospora sp. CA-290183 TaxID=3240006 RepID=UPI003D9408CE